jgi:ACR3 family arsenite efflux pump ArsB
LIIVGLALCIAWLIRYMLAGGDRRYYAVMVMLNSAFHAVMYSARLPVLVFVPAQLGAAQVVAIVCGASRRVS